jgi:hypothetical protein
VVTTTAAEGLLEEVIVATELRNTSLLLRVIAATETSGAPIEAAPVLTPMGAFIAAMEFTGVAILSAAITWLSQGKVPAFNDSGITSDDIEALNNFGKNIANQASNQSQPPKTPPVTSPVKPTPVPDTTPQQSLQPSTPVQAKPIDPADTDSGREIEDDIHITAQVPVQIFNVSEQATPTPLPFEANPNGQPGLANGSSPDFGSSIAAQALKACLMAHPVVRLAIPAPIPGPAAGPFKAGPGVSTFTGDPEGTGVISGAFRAAGFFSGSFTVGIDDGGYVGPIFQAGLWSTDQIPVPLPPPQSDIFTGGVYQRQNVPPGKWIGGVEYTPAPVTDPNLQAALWETFLGYQVFVKDGTTPTIGGAPNVGWNITVFKSFVITSGNSAPIVPGPPSAGTVLASGTFDSNGQSPLPDITILPSYYLPTMSGTATTSTGHPDHILGPYDGEMDISITFALNIGIQRTGTVYAFDEVKPGSTLVVRGRGMTWRHPNNSVWSVPVGYFLLVLTAGQFTPVVLNDEVTKTTLSDRLINGDFATQNFKSNLQTLRPTDNYAVTMGKQGRAAPLSNPQTKGQNLSLGDPLLAQTGGIPQRIPFGGYQFGFQYFGGADDSTPTNRFTHFIQIAGSDHAYITRFFNFGNSADGVDSSGNTLPNALLLQDVGGFMWALDVSGNVTNPFYDAIGTSGPGAFVDIPTVTVSPAFDPTQRTFNTNNPAPAGQDNTHINLVPPEGALNLFAMCLAWMIDDTIKTDRFTDYVLPTRAFELRIVRGGASRDPIDFFDPRFGPLGIQVLALSTKGWAYQYFARPAAEGEIINNFQLEEFPQGGPLSTFWKDM